MEVVLRPLVQGMVVAVGTFHPTAHKDFCGKLRLQPGIFDRDKERCRAVLGRITLGR